MIKLLKIFIICLLIFPQNIPCQIYGQNTVTNYQTLINLCNYDSIRNNLQELQKLGIKEANTAAIKNTLNWLVNKYKNYGYENIDKDSFSFSSDNLNNLIVTKKGILFPDSILVICGHYDTKNGTGIGDNGSGTAVILEIARILKNTKTNISIRFIHFAAEEDGLIGSNHYVKQLINKEKPKIKLVFNIDAVGGVSTKTNDKIVCESDQNKKPSYNNEQSMFYANLLANYMKEYSTLEPISGKTYGSDYMPFQAEGYIITGLYEFNQSPYAHTTEDVIENVDIQYIYQVARGALGASLHFSEVKLQ